MGGGRERFGRVGIESRENGEGGGKGGRVCGIEDGYSGANGGSVGRKVLVVSFRTAMQTVHSLMEPGNHELSGASQLKHMRR